MRRQDVGAQGWISLGKTTESIHFFSLFVFKRSSAFFFPQSNFSTSHCSSKHTYLSAVSFDSCGIDLQQRHGLTSEKQKYMLACLSCPGLCSFSPRADSLTSPALASPYPSRPYYSKPHHPSSITRSLSGENQTSLTCPFPHSAMQLSARVAMRTVWAS